MSELAYDIEQLWIEGMHPVAIARTLRCPLEMVNAWIHEHSLGVDNSSESQYYGA